MNIPDKDSFEWNDKGFRDVENEIFKLSLKSKLQQINKKKDSLSFTFFEEIRNEELGQYDIIRKLRDITNNYDKELLLALKKDVALYLSLYKEKEEYSYSFETIEMAVRNREQEGLEIPYKKPLEGKLKDLNSRLNQKKNIDVEKLLFPHEFTPIYKIQKMIEDKIQEENNASPEPKYNQINWEFTELEITELGKALCEMKKPKGTSEREAIQALGNFFNLNINKDVKTKKLETIKKRQETPHFLEELAAHISTWAKK